MTNSIWHKASDKPELNKYVVVRKHGFAQWKVFKFDNKTIFYEPFTDDLWAYVADIIAQADKAERLQKAVDLALVGLANSQTYATMSGNHGLSDMLYDKYIKEIKQLIKDE